MEKELVGKIKYLINKKKDFRTICKELELKDYELIGMVELMKQEGCLVDYVGGEIIKLKKPLARDGVYRIPNNSEHLKLLLISDTHLCNKADRLDILRYLYDKAEDVGVRHIIHSGDLTDGIYTNRPQQLYELRCFGFDEHLAYVVEKYPSFNGKTYFIGGNHQDTYFRNGGSDIGVSIAKERSDMVYLGPDTADLNIGKVGIHLHHGAGGRAYSVSYKLQRYVETLPQNKKIDIVTQGHFHNSMYMYYMGKHCFQVGALEDETPFSRSMGFKNEKSCYWLDINLDDNGEVCSITPELEVFEKKLVRRRK